MPIHDLGYRPWEGEHTPDSARWWVIAQTGIRVALRSAWLRRMLLFAWLPAIYTGALFFGFEQQVKISIEQPVGPSQVFSQLPVDQIRNTARRYHIRLDDVSDDQIRRFLAGERIVSEQGTHEHTVEVQARRRLQHIRDIWESETQNRLRRSIFGQFLAPFSGSDVVLDEVEKNQHQLDKARPTVWSWILMTFFRAPQGIAMVLLVGLIAPTLIANDVRSKAFLLYFSRPISLLEYVIGKAAVIWFFVALITTVPALGLYVLAVLLSPDLSVVLNTWHIPLLILLASVVLMVPTSAIALMLSSLTSESRYAGFAWFALWALGFAAYMMISQPWDGDRSGLNDPGWKLMSLYHALGEVQSWVFGLGANSGVLWGALAILLSLTVFSLLTLSRRVAAPIRV